MDPDYNPFDMQTSNIHNVVYYTTNIGQKYNKVTQIFAIEFIKCVWAIDAIVYALKLKVNI